MVKIRVRDRKLLQGIVHGSVWRQPPFSWEPTAFVIESPKLEQKIVDADRQIKSLELFMANPRAPMVYVVAGNPDDSKARYFAAYLASIHKASAAHRADIVWESVHGGFENQLLKKDLEPSMLILSNLAENSTAAKIEKAKDLIDRYPSIPRIVVCAGEDPVSFTATRLHCAAQGIAYFPGSLSRTVQEVM